MLDRSTARWKYLGMTCAVLFSLLGLVGCHFHRYHHGYHEYDESDTHPRYGNHRY